MSPLEIKSKFEWARGLMKWSLERRNLAVTFLTTVAVRLTHSSSECLQMLEKLIAPQMVSNFLASYGTNTFNTGFTKPHHRSTKFAY